MHAIVLGGSRGIGHAIAKSLHKAGCDVYAASKKDIDTSDLESVKKFASAHPKTDVLVLNTGGPPPMEFDDITEEDWQKYHNQLFLGFCLLVRQINIADGGYLFLISSSVVKEPSARLAVSTAEKADLSLSTSPETPNVKFDRSSGYILMLRHQNLSWHQICILFYFLLWIRSNRQFL